MSDLFQTTTEKRLLMGKTIKFAASYDNETRVCTLTRPRKVEKDFSLESVSYGIISAGTSQGRRIDKHTMQFVVRETYDPVKVLSQVLNDEIIWHEYRINRLRIDNDDPDFWYHVVALVAHEIYERQYTQLLVDRDRYVIIRNSMIAEAYADIDEAVELIQAIDAEIVNATRLINSLELAQRNRRRAKEPDINKIADIERILSVTRSALDFLADSRVIEQCQIVNLKQRIRARTDERDTLVASVERKLAKVAEVPDEMLRRIVGLE